METILSIHRGQTPVTSTMFDRIICKGRLYCTLFAAVMSREHAMTLMPEIVTCEPWEPISTSTHP